MRHRMTQDPAELATQEQISYERYKREKDLDPSNEASYSPPAESTNN